MGSVYNNYDVINLDIDKNRYKNHLKQTDVESANEEKEIEVVSSVKPPKAKKKVEVITKKDKIEVTNLEIPVVENKTPFYFEMFISSLDLLLLRDTSINIDTCLESKLNAYKLKLNFNNIIKELPENSITDKIKRLTKVYYVWTTGNLSSILTLHPTQNDYYQSVIKLINKFSTTD